MGDSIYRKYGAALDPSGMQEGINAQKTNLKDILGGITELMKIQEQGYVRENTLNVQNYFKNKLDSGGLNTALTQPINQEEIKQRFGNMIDLNAVNSTVATQTDLLKKTAIEAVETEANDVLTKTKDPLQAAEVFQKSLRAKGATNSFVDEQLPAYISRKATEVQNITAEFERDGAVRLNKVLDVAAQSETDSITGKVTGGYVSGKLAIEAALVDVPERKKAAERDRLTKALDSASVMTDHNKIVMKGFVDADATESQRLLNAAENRSVLLDQNLLVAQRAGVQDKYYTNVNGMGLIDVKTGQPVKSAVNVLGDIVNNWFEKAWGGSTSESNQLRQIRTQLGTVVDAQDADAILVQAFQEAYDGGGRFGNDLNEEGLAAIRARVKNLAENRHAVKALQEESVKAKLDISNVKAQGIQRSIKLQQSLLNVGRDISLSRGKGEGDAQTLQSFTTAYDNFRKNMSEAIAGADTKLLSGHTPKTTDTPGSGTLGDKNAQVMAILGKNPDGTPKTPAAAPADGTTPAPAEPAGKANLQAAATKKVPTTPAERKQQTIDNAHEGYLFKAGVKMGIFKDNATKPPPTNFGDRLDNAAEAHNKNTKNKVKVTSTELRAIWNYESTNSEDLKLPATDKHGKKTSKYSGPMQLDRDFFSGQNSAHAATPEGHAKVSTEVLASKVTRMKELGIPDTPINRILAYNQGADGLNVILKAVKNNTPMANLPNDVQEGIRNNLKGVPADQQTPARYLTMHTKKAQDALNNARARKIKNGR